jgi:DNA replication protein DnaC
MSDMTETLKALGLHYCMAHLDDALALATQKRFSPLQFVEYLVGEEMKERRRRSLERRLKDSRLGHFKPMAKFDWNWPKAIDREAVESSLRLEFLPEPRNLIFVAPQGLGKTMIAQNIAHQAILSGRSVLVISAAQMLLDLAAQDSARMLEMRLRHYNAFDLLVLDEVGYLAFDSRNADLLFQVVSRRYERKSLILTTNLAFSDWPSIFPNASCATALIDRVVHHADILTIEGESYRLHEAMERKQSRRSKSSKTTTKAAAE